MLLLKLFLVTQNSQGNFFLSYYFWSFNSFYATDHLSPEKIKKPKVLLYFQGVYKKASDLKKVKFLKSNLGLKLVNPFLPRLSQSIYTGRKANHKIFSRHFRMLLKIFKKRLRWLKNCCDHN